MNLYVIRKMHHSVYVGEIRLGWLQMLVWDDALCLGVFICQNWSWNLYDVEMHYGLFFLSTTSCLICICVLAMSWQCPDYGLVVLPVL